MKLNQEEKRFVKCWARNFAEAIKCSEQYRKCFHVDFESNEKIADMQIELEDYLYNYASYKYWYGILFGMIQAMSLDIRIGIYDACSHALNNITSAAYNTK